MGTGAQGMQEAAGRVLSCSSDISPWRGRDGLTGQDKTEAHGQGGGGATDGKQVGRGWGGGGRRQMRPGREETKNKMRDKISKARQTVAVPNLRSSAWNPGRARLG